MDHLGKFHLKIPNFEFVQNLLNVIQSGIFMNVHFFYCVQHCYNEVGRGNHNEIPYNLYESLKGIEKRNYS